MKKAFSLLLFLGFCIQFIAVAQEDVITYKIFDDYKLERGVNIGQLQGLKISIFGKVTLITNFNGSKEKLPLEDVWGFSYKGELFRVFKGLLPAKLVDKGSLNYYENGIAHLDMLMNNTSNGEFSNGPYCFFSFGIDGEIVSCPKQMHASQPYRYFKRYRKKNFSKSEVLDCMESYKFDHYLIRRCVAEYNFSHPEEGS